MDLTPAAEQGHDGTVSTIANDNDKRQQIAAVGETLPPFEPIKWRAGGGRMQQCSKGGITLHFLKIIVIFDRNHTPNPPPPGAPSPCLPACRSIRNRSITWP
ncbi:hypothetical protein GCM10023306_12380 [Novosphingobium ginsenosidimutans]